MSWIELAARFGKTYWIYGVAGVAILSAVHLKANHDYNRGKTDCEIEYAKQVEDAKVKSDVIEDASDASNDAIEDEAAKLSDEINQSDNQAETRVRSAERQVVYWRQRYAELERNTNACDGQPLDDDYRVLNDQTRTDSLGNRGSDTP